MTKLSVLGVPFRTAATSGFNIKIGDLTVSKIYIGTQTVSKIYIGATQL